MAEAFKNFIDARVVRDIGQHLSRVWPGFDRRRFDSLALDALDTLELKARVAQVAEAVCACLPPDVDRALAILVASLGPPGPVDRVAEVPTTSAGLGGWAVWPLTEVVSRIAIDRPAAGLEALHAMTQRFSAEFAIRPFIARWPHESLARLEQWARDPHAAVRRLASEGCRPRLPWAMRLRALVADPAPVLPVLEALQDDPCDSVRLSVANHLNDIAKDHPAIVHRWLERHLPGASPQRRALLRHACRTLIKRGDPQALAAWGAGQALRGTAQLRLTPRRVAIGESVTVEVLLRSTSRRPQNLVIDYLVHLVRNDASTAPKVFKGWVVELGAGEVRALRKPHPFRPVTTRPTCPGRHAFELQVNGRIVAQDEVALVAAGTASQGGSRP